MSTNRCALICFATVCGEQRNYRFSTHIGEIRGRLKRAISIVATSPLGVRRSVSYLKLTTAVESPVILYDAQSGTILMILLNHHWTLLLAAGSTAHHYDIRAFLDHLKMLRHSVPNGKDNILLSWLCV